MIEGLKSDPHETNSRPHSSDSARIAETPTVAGAWPDPDWDEMTAAFDRIRHESKSSPIDVRAS